MAACKAKEESPAWSRYARIASCNPRDNQARAWTAEGLLPKRSLSFFISGNLYLKALLAAAPRLKNMAVSGEALSSVVISTLTPALLSKGGVKAPGFPARGITR